MEKHDSHIKYPFIYIFLFIFSLGCNKSSEDIARSNIADTKIRQELFKIIASKEEYLSEFTRTLASSTEGMVTVFSDNKLTQDWVINCPSINELVKKDTSTIENMMVCLFDLAKKDSSICLKLSEYVSLNPQIFRQFRNNHDLNSGDKNILIFPDNTRVTP